MQKEWNATYVGDQPSLKEKTAIVRLRARHDRQPVHTDNDVLVQFDDIKGLPMDLTHGWTVFPASQFVERVHCDGKHEPEVRADPAAFRPTINPAFAYLYDENGNDIAPIPTYHPQRNLTPVVVGHGGLRGGKTARLKAILDRLKVAHPEIITTIQRDFTLPSLRERFATTYATPTGDWDLPSRAKILADTMKLIDMGVKSYDDGLANHPNFSCSYAPIETGDQTRARLEEEAAQNHWPSPFIRENY